MVYSSVVESRKYLIYKGPRLDLRNIGINSLPTRMLSLIYIFQEQIFHYAHVPMIHCALWLLINNTRS